jgi:hypothetical protein
VSGKGLAVQDFDDLNPGKALSARRMSEGSHRYHFNLTGMIKEIAYPNKAIIQGAI